MSRSDFDSTDKYAFYLAYNQECGYCTKHVAFSDVQIDHIVPQHLAKDGAKWQEALANFGLPPDFPVDGDENRMSSCGQDNCLKSGVRQLPIVGLAGC